MVCIPKDSPRVPEQLRVPEVLLIPSCHPSLAPLPDATRTRNTPARGRRPHAARRSRSAAPGAARDACCKPTVNIPLHIVGISSPLKEVDFRRKSPGGATQCAKISAPLRPPSRLIPLGRLKIAPRSPKIAPRSPQEAPRSPPATPSSRQERLRATQERPRVVQRPSWRHLGSFWDLWGGQNHFFAMFFNTC